MSATDRLNGEFDALYESTKQSVLKYIAPRCSCIADIEDVYQEVYLRVYDALRQQKHLDDPEAFVMGITKHCVSHYYSVLQKLKIYGVQKLVFNMYDKAINLVKPDEFGMISWDEVSDAKRNEMIERYFINSEFWTPEIIKPLMMIFAAVTLVTIILMVLNMNRFDRDIAASMSKGRKRR
ncbi:Sigma-70 region 2 [Ruminococcaceae bacterium FB2012]|nr:Sigma-70 region 2 [Ruminococcaceae bacterium FB2012]